MEDLLRALTSPDLAEIVALTLRVTGIALIISTIIGAPLGALIGLSKSFPARGWCGRCSIPAWVCRRWW